MTAPIDKSKIAAMLAAIRAKKGIVTAVESTLPVPAPAPEATNYNTGIGKAGNLITYNSEQQEFISLARVGKSCILIGAAGTGKTTCMMGAITALIQSNRVPVFSKGLDHKWLQEGTPGIVATSFTRRAVTNLRRAMPNGMEHNCITLHKLLEFAPVFYEVFDSVSGEYKKTMRFEPTRNAHNPLPREIKVIIIDESSMVSTDLFKLLMDALDHQAQFIFLGDIQQLPPIFGPAILGFKMLELRTVELTQVYRQALESPIIKYATKIKDGEGWLLPEKLVEETSKGKVTFHPWKKKLSADIGCATAAKFLVTAYDLGAYNPETDMILCPFNKQFGTIELNKALANHIAKKEKRVVWEIVTGFSTCYMSVGDKVLYDKEDAIVVKIQRNAGYCGRVAQKESRTLDYWGHEHSLNGAPETKLAVGEEESEEDIDYLLEQMTVASGGEERVRAASHIVTVRMADSDEEIDIDSAADLNAMVLSYALTVHKAQGSEWDKVFLILSQMHNTMIQRELLYTAVTRAAKELYVICESDTFEKGVKSQRIKGNTLLEKSIYFQGVKEKNGNSY